MRSAGAAHCVVSNACGEDMATNAMKKQALLSSAAGVIWFIIWLVSGAATLEWLFVRDKYYFELLLPVAFICWIASLFIGRTIIAAVARRLPGVTSVRANAGSLLDGVAPASPVVSTATAPYVWGPSPEHPAPSTEIKERMIDLPSTQVPLELTSSRAMAATLTIYFPQKNVRQRVEVMHFLKHAQVEYQRTITRESLS